MTRFLLASGDNTFEQQMRAAYADSLNGDLRRVAPASSPAAIVSSLNSEGLSDAEVVALGPDLPVDVALEVASLLDAGRPDISVVLVAMSSPTTLRRALHAGVRDVVSPDADGASIQATFEQAAEITLRRRAAISPAGSGTGDRHNVVVVVSPKGGSGKTTVATNLAVGLAMRDSGSVALVDLDLQFGDVASALALMPEATAVEAQTAVAAGDVMALKVFLTPHESGVFALCAPESPAEGDHLTGEHAAKTVSLLSRDFRTIVVDTAAGLTEHTLSALEVATDIVFVCSMDVPSVRSLRKEVMTLDQLGMVTQRRHFVLNRADSRVGLDAEDVASTVGMPIDVAIPSSRSVPLAMNQGLPLIKSDPRSPVSRRLVELVDRFAGATDRAHQPGGWFKKRATS